MIGGTPTGRKASPGPNLQPIPVRTEIGRQIREAFMAQTEKPNWVEWKGGERPIPADTMVKVWFACDHSEAAALAYPARPARFWDEAWRRKRTANRIKAYLVVQP